MDWFATADGQLYLAKRLDEDTKLLRDNRINPLLPKLDSAKMWRGIETGMGSTPKYELYKHRKVGLYWYVAAAILIACTLSGIFYWLEFSGRQIIKTSSLSILQPPPGSRNH